MINCANQVAFCRLKMCPCNCIGREEKCNLHTAGCQQIRGKVPTIEIVRGLYQEMHGPNLSDHCKSVLTEIARLQRNEGLGDDDQIDSITYEIIEHYVDSLDIRNVSRIGVCSRIQSFVGRRERMFYRKNGYDVRSVDIPLIDDDTRAYQTISESQTIKLLSWYRSLQFHQDPRRRIFAMLMLKFAMRNSDVRRLKWSNFHVVGGKWQLVYIPHKTEKATAGRSVKIWVNPTDQVELMTYRGNAGSDDFVIPSTGFGRMRVDGLQRSLNASLREIGFTGSKGLYELRKLCIDTVYHTQGAEAASAYSGDDYKTVKFHYADTSSMNLRGISDDAIGQR